MFPSLPDPLKLNALYEFRLSAQIWWPLLENDQLAAMERLVAKLAAVSSGPESFTGLLIQEINNQSPDQDTLFLLSSYRENPIVAMMDVLTYRGISASNAPPSSDT